MRILIIDGCGAKHFTWIFSGSKEELLNEWKVKQGKIVSMLAPFIEFVSIWDINS